MLYATRCPSADNATPPTDRKRERSRLTSPCAVPAGEVMNRVAAKSANAQTATDDKRERMSFSYECLRNGNGHAMLGPAQSRVNPPAQPSEAAASRSGIPVPHFL